MELTTLFAWGVGITCSIHLLSTVAGSLGIDRYSKGNKQAKRDDWYCFFKPSDLLGTNWSTPSDSNSGPQHTITSDQLEQRRQQQAKRPRLHV